MSAKLSAAQSLLSASESAQPLKKLSASVSGLKILSMSAERERSQF